MPLHYLAWRAVLDPMGVEFSEKVFYDLAGMPSEKVIESVAKGRWNIEEKEGMIHAREEHFFGMLDQVQPVEAVVEIAREHRGQLKMAVASGSQLVSVRKQLTALGTLDWFDAIVAAEDTERHKPEPDVFLEAARRLQIEPACCRVYEDSDLGLLAASRAGMEAVDVRPMYMN